MQILASSDNSKLQKEFLIPKIKAEDNKDWLHIKIDYSKNEFVAKKIIGTFSVGDHWINFDDYTFPSSLLNEFMNSDIKV